MNKVALITGSTDGIGRAIAVELARKGFTIHLLGRSEERGQDIFDQLTKIRPQNQHKLFLLDLASIRENRRFLEEYVNEQNTLDLLILNANARVKKSSPTEDMIDKTFAVGCLSRYMFSVRLNALLDRAQNSRVVHIGDATSIANINYKAISSGRRLSMLRATYLSYSASALLAYWFNASGMTMVPHEIMAPGTVNTRQLKELQFLPGMLLRFLGVIEPKECGHRIVSHILATEASDVAAKFYTLEKEKAVSKKLRRGRQEFDALLEFCQRVTEIQVCEMT